MRRRRLAALATIVGVLALLAAGGGYAIASGGGTSACAQRTHSNKCASGNAKAVPASAATRPPATPGAYAHVLYNPATNTATMNLEHGMGTATVRVDGDGGFCFENLPFTPRNATATVDFANDTSVNDIAHVAISPKRHRVCLLYWRACARGDD